MSESTKSLLKSGTKNAIRLFMALVVVCAASDRAFGAVLDWTAQSWTTGALTATYTIGTGANQRDVTVTVSGATGNIVNAANQAGAGYNDPASINDVHYLQGNLTNTAWNAATPPEVLFIKLNNMTAADTLTVTFTFTASGSATSGNVTGVNIPIFDIDSAPPGTYIDQVRVSGKLGTNAAINPGVTTFGANAAFGANGIQGNRAAEQSGAGSADGTGIFDFGSNVINQFTIDYKNVQTGGGAGGIQWIGISTINFNPTNVPEPGTFIMLGAFGAVCGACYWRRRTQLRRAA